MESNLAIRMVDLTKYYGEYKAVDSINLEIGRGECFGLLGPNGAGKSSTMRMTYGSSLVSSGRLEVLGLDISKDATVVKSKIGVVPQEDGLDPDFTVLENLLVYSRYNGISQEEALIRAQDLLRLMKLEDYSDKPVDTLSGGMKRRLTIARGLINNPDLIFLDEPTTGLDPQARLWIWNFFRNLKAHSKTIVLTTHYLEEAEQLCDRVAIMDHGKILAVGQPQVLIRTWIGTEVVEVSMPSEDHEYYLRQLQKAQFEAQSIDNNLVIFVKPEQLARDVVSLLKVEHLSIRKANLNDVFLKLAGYQVRND